MGADKNPSRYNEIDLLRGIALIMMIWFHFLFDLSYFSIAPVNTSTGFWKLFAYVTAVLFVSIAGLSIYISSRRAAKKLAPRGCLIKVMKRGLFILAIAAGISIVTYCIIGDGWIVFGVLHLIGFSILISPLFIRFGVVNIIPAALFIAAGLLISMGFVGNITDNLWLIPFGFHPADFYSVDYVPVLPWTGVFLAGVAAGAYLYPDGVRSGRLEKICSAAPEYLKCGIAAKIEDLIVISGRHTLIVYLLHQPVIIALLMIVSGHSLLF